LYFVKLSTALKSVSVEDTVCVCTVFVVEHVACDCMLFII